MIKYKLTRSVITFDIKNLKKHIVNGIRGGAFGINGGEQFVRLYNFALSEGNSTIA